MRCPNCGIETNEKVCPNCGANFQKTINKIKCPNCGIETTEKICPNCGADFSKTITTTSSENTNDEPKQAEQEARIESSPLETFLNYTPTVKIREQQSKNDWKKRKIKKIAIGAASFVLVIALIVGIVCCTKADFDRRVKEDLDSRFGDIELSQEEIDAWAYYLTH